MPNVNIRAKPGFILELAEKVFVVLSLLFFSGAIVSIEETNKSSPLLEALMRIGLPLTVLIGSLLLIAAWHRQVFALVKREKLLWILIGIALLSVFWSDAPTATLRRSLVLINSTAFGVYFAARYSLKEQLRLLGWTFGIAAVLSLILIGGFPQYGVMGVGGDLVGESQELKHQGAWRGIYVHKNILGSTMALSAIVFFLLSKSSRRDRPVAWTGVSLSVVLLLGSTSRLALVILLLAIAAWLIYLIFQWLYTLVNQCYPNGSRFLLIGLSATVLAIALIALFNLETILQASGRDLTFSGRTRLWLALLGAIWDRPWLGYGYGGFWLVSDASEGIRQIFGEWAAHGHNGFLDLWLDLGLVGLSVFIYSFLTVCLQALVKVYQHRTAISIWPLVYLVFLFFTNMTESALFNPQASLFWVLYVAIALSLPKPIDEMSPQAKRGRFR